jgi:hypothetical protein
MAKKRSVRIGSVELEELMFAFGLCHAAASLKMAVENPQLKGFNLANPDGSVTRFTLTDRPLNRGGLAVAEHFKGDKFENLMMRIFAIGDVYQHEKLSPWVRNVAGGEEIAESLLYAAARAKLTRAQTFDVDEIVKLASVYDEEHDLIDS